MKQALCIWRGPLLALTLLLSCIAMPAAAADEKADSKADKAAPKDMVLKGDAVCTRCHDETESYPVLSIAKTRHGTVADGRTPTCTSCHGDSKRHVENLRKEGESGRPKPDRTFSGQLLTAMTEDRVDRYFGVAGKRTSTPVAERNSACLGCHQGGKRIHWQGSAHESREVACTSCHQVHTQHDKVRDKLTQPEVCFACHKEQRAQVNRPSRHPVREGKVACTDCHNPHGTTVANLLKSRPPFLCQQCHEPTSHRGNIPGLLTGTGNAAGTRGLAQARACLNCHTNIHGGNNPTNNAESRSLRR